MKKKLIARYWLIFVATSVTYTAAVPLAARAWDDSAQAVQGVWKPVKAELAGQLIAEAILKSISLKLDNGTYEVSVAGSPDQGTYTLDSTTTPKSITITGTAGPNRGKTFPAIYELSGKDTLRICYDLSGVKRPTEFKSIAGAKLYLVTYNRVK